MAKKTVGIAIQKGIPIPKTYRGRASKYPWAEMQKADSFFIQTKSASEAEVAKKKLTASAFTFRRHNKALKFTVHVVTEGKKVGVRAWRVV